MLSEKKVPKDFHLSKEENKKLFEEIVIPEIKEVYDFESQENPSIFLSAGLPGAGKSALTIKEKNLNFKENTFVPNSDDFRAYHPRYREAGNIFGVNAGAAIFPNATQLLIKATDYAINNKIDFILDSTLKDPVKAAQLLDKLKMNKYSIKVNMIGVNAYESKQGIFNRYVEQYIDKPDTARFTNPKFIDIGMDNMIKSAHVIDKKNPYEFQILDREHNILYDNRIDTEKSAKEVMKNLTELKKFSKAKRNKIEKDWYEIVNKLKKANVPKEIQGKAEALHKSLKEELQEIRK